MTDHQFDFGNHPCFNAAVRHSTGRIHLPVAPKCNIQCNFCNRRYDCVNETRPGVTSSVLAPSQALSYLGKVLEKVPNISVVGIAGPGDPFANPDETMDTLELIGEEYPEKILCLASNGLNVAPYIDRLKKLNVSHVTVTVNAVDPEIGAQIYSWVRSGPHVYRGVEGAAVLLENQTKTIKALHDAGILIKINTIIIPGINDTHAEAVAKYCKELGASIQNCIPMMCVEGSVFENHESPSAEMMSAVRTACAAHLEQMCHCARCRADAVGLIGEENNSEIVRMLSDAAKLQPTENRPYVAVASRDGLFVNQHLGEATELWVYRMSADGTLELVTERPTPVPGTGDERWKELALGFSDCFAVLCAGCGDAPVRVLKKEGLPVIVMEGLVEEGASALAKTGKVPQIYLKRAGVCERGRGCSGGGSGC
ncbi:MAG: nitrogenase cofactor biosynthesis protein NifB [Treponema sp.]|nr:nitrogenase cofactor biosynthesis protein NifB [Treponema sp.]